MRCQRRNKQPIWYALYEGQFDVVNDAGKQTGEKIQSYSDPVCVHMNVSAARGSSGVEIFGIDTPYTKTLVTDDMNCPIAEDSVLWIERDPSQSEYNYIVVSIARSLDSIVYAVREVDVR